MLRLEIDITDWHDEVAQEELYITDKADIVEAIEHQKSTIETAKAAIVNQAIGNMKEGEFDPPKSLVLAGGVQNVARIVKQRRMDIEAPSGKTYSIPAFVGAVHRQPLENSEDVSDGQPSYVSSDSRAALDRAKEYLENVVPGHIWNRFILIAAQGGNVEAESVKLIVKIKEMVQKLK